MAIGLNKFTKRSSAATMGWQPLLMLPDNTASMIVVSTTDWDDLTEGVALTLDGEASTAIGAALPWAIALVFKRSLDTAVGTFVIVGYNQFGDSVTETIVLAAGGAVETETAWCYSLVTSITCTVKGAGTTQTLNIGPEESLAGASPARTSFIALPARIIAQADILDYSIVDELGVAGTVKPAIVEFVGEPYHKIGLTANGLDNQHSLMRMYLNKDAVGL